MVKIGTKIPTVEEIKSYSPYSAVESIEVYSGTKKKESNFVAKLLNVRSPIFFIRYLYLLIYDFVLEFYKLYVAFSGVAFSIMITGRIYTKTLNIIFLQ